MQRTLATSQFDAAMRAVDAEDAGPEEKAEMLMEVAMGIQQRPKSPQDIEQAIALYERALAICPGHAPLARARIRARMGTALQALPTGGTASLHKAQACFEDALVELKARGTPAEVAETEMNLGLATQSLAAAGAARIQDAIQAYHRALRLFTREAYPQEFSILHNNLAIAYLSMPLSDERGRMREALAVQSFEEVLKVVNLVDHPVEYAMIQNNLGNALQYASTSHALENNVRALAAYEEALKVRNARDTPLEYANTISNMANVIRNLPVDTEAATADPDANLRRARELYCEAQRLFDEFGQADSAGVVVDAIADLDRELDAVRPPPPAGNGRGAGIGGDLRIHA